jgi:hypothetical protein
MPASVPEPGGRCGDGWRGRQRVLRRAPARPPCRAQPRHGLLPVQLRGDRCHYARVRYGAERIAVVDFDVHHGNGTQDIFWSDRDLFYGSTHQMPLYPGTGAASETGVGNIWNAPLRPGDGGPQFRDALRGRILTALADFRPDLIIVSAGFDAHRNDPLAISNSTRRTSPGRRSPHGGRRPALPRPAGVDAGRRL